MSDLVRALTPTIRRLVGMVHAQAWSTVNRAEAETLDEFVAVTYFDQATLHADGYPADKA